ncbi:MAG: hypothetical protein FWC36_02300 [Spirochaetes bacterium]|nr:hypothetical protein [Spirochaetota bacterium]
MVQFYVLSILVNLLGGFLLAGDVISKRFSSSGFYQKITKSEVYMMIFAIIAAIAGIFKIISVLEGNIPIIGDLLPALASFTLAIHFFCKYLLEKKGMLEGTLGTIDLFIENYKTLIGIACIIIAILHFLFPSALFL